MPDDYFTKHTELVNQLRSSISVANEQAAKLRNRGYNVDFMTVGEDPNVIIAAKVHRILNEEYSL